MAAQSIERHRALAGEQLARPMAHQLGLVVDRTHRHEGAGQDDPLPRKSPPHRPRRSCCAGHRASHARAAAIEPRARVRSAPAPMMRRGARLHRHHARRQRGEKREELAARKLARHHDLSLRVNSVNLKRSLRQIQANLRDSRQISDRFTQGRLPFRWGFDNDILAR